MAPEKDASSATPISTTTNANGETIRIFRRSRTETRAVSGVAGSSSTTTISEHLPPPDTPAATREAANKLRQLVSRLKGQDGNGANGGQPIDPESLISNLEYISDVVQTLASKNEEEPEDDLSELQSEAVPDEVRKWLASTFAKQEAPARRAGEERPSFKSVANAIRTGIFIERIYRRMSSSQLMAIPPDIAKVLKGIDDWSFDTFHLNRVSKGAPLRYMGYELLTRHGCLHKYKIPPSMLESLLVLVEQGYCNNGNPYHNNMHACDVLQTTHYFISRTGLANWLTDLEVFACLISALIHDFDHSGTNNQFHVNSNTELALLYNDRAVLENHHVSAFFKLISENSGSNIFNNMQKTDYREFRSLVIDMVLHTDMSQHFSQLKAMKKLLEAPPKEGIDKTKVLCLLVHSCDVSHPSKRWDIHHQWTSRCMEEFFVQGDREQKQGLDCSPLCDRENTLIPESQVGFIDYIVQPTLTVLGDTLDTMMAQLKGEERKPSSENGPGMAATKDPSDASKGQSGSESAPITNTDPIHRPWTEILPINRSKWQESADKGERGIELPNDSWYAFSRPSSAKSNRSNASATSSATSGGQQSCSCPGPPNNNIVNHSNPLQAADLAPKSVSPLTPSSGGTKQGSLQKQVGGGLRGSARDTKLADIMDEVPESVISPPGSPRAQWSFTEKEAAATLEASPPPPSRPNSSNRLSPPMPRKVPISIDHKLRK